MAIRFSCDCGQSITARAEFAGRKVQCTACKKIHVVPGVKTTAAATQPAAKPPAPPPRPVAAPRPTPPPPARRPEPPPPPEPTYEEETPLFAMPADDVESDPAINLELGRPDDAPIATPVRPAMMTSTSTSVMRFLCACGSEFQAKPEHAGQPTRCNRCGEVLFIPTRERMKQTDGQPVLVAFDRSDRYKPKREPGTAFRSGLLVLLLLALLGGSAFAYWEFYGRDQVDKEALAKEQKVQQLKGQPNGGPRGAQMGNQGQRGGAAGMRGGQQAMGGNPMGAIGIVNPMGGMGGAMGAMGGRPGREEVEAPKPIDEAKATALDLVPQDAIGFVSIRVSDVWNSPDVKKQLQMLPKEQLDQLTALETSLKLKVGEVERVVVVMPQADSESVWMAVEAKDLLGTNLLKVLELGPAAEQRYPGGKSITYHPAQGKKDINLRFVNNRLAVLAPKKGMESHLSNSHIVGRKAGEPLEAGFKAANGKKPIVVAAAAPAELMQQAKANLPPQADAFKALLEIQSAVLTTEATQDAPSTLEAFFPDAKSAEAANTSVTAALAMAKIGLTSAKKEIPEELFKMMSDGLAGIKNEVKQSTVQVTIPASAPLLAGALVPAVQKVRDAANRAAHANNLKQMALAIINYADQNDGNLPTHAIYSKDGKPLFSWRVAILPQLDMDGLYKQLKLDEPWDSAHNKPILDKMPKVFENPGAPAPQGMTYYQLFTGPETAFVGKSPSRFPAAFADGTSNTILVTESAQPVHWAAPGDMVYSKDVSPLKQIGFRSPVGALAVFADGSVRTISAMISEKTLRALITPAGDEKLDKDAP